MHILDEREIARKRDSERASALVAAASRKGGMGVAGGFPHAETGTALGLTGMFLVDWSTLSMRP